MLYVHYLHLKWDDAAGGGTQISATQEEDRKQHNSLINTPHYCAADIKIILNSKKYHLLLFCIFVVRTYQMITNLYFCCTKVFVIFYFVTIWGRGGDCKFSIV